MNDADRLVDLERLIRIFGIEIQVGGDEMQWQIRVRGKDPTGALHEEPYVKFGDMTLIDAQWCSVKEFMRAFGIG